MCLAIYQPVGKEVPEKHLKTGFDNHSDGCGIAWADGGKLHIKKGVGMKFDEFYEFYKSVKQYPCLIHFRKSTSGKIDEANCHPFLFADDKYAAIHNGVINIKCNDKDFSDTYHFIKLVLDPLIRKYNIPINDGSLNYLLCTSIGSDKLAVMDGNGKTYIFNEEKGNWEDGVWYSNTSFRWSYGTTTTTYYGEHSSYYKGSAAGFASSNSPNVGGTSRGWPSDGEDENDEAYLEFWRRQTTPIGSASATAAQQTALLLGPPASSKKSDAAIDIEGQMDEGDSERETNKSKLPGPGEMAEYGWFDAETEHDIEGYQVSMGLTREEAMIKVFTER